MIAQAGGPATGETVPDSHTKPTSHPGRRVCRAAVPAPRPIPAPELNRPPLRRQPGREAATRAFPSASRSRFLPQRDSGSPGRLSRAPLTTAQGGRAPARRPPREADSRQPAGRRGSGGVGGYRGGRDASPGSSGAGPGPRPGGGCGEGGVAALRPPSRPRPLPLAPAEGGGRSGAGPGVGGAGAGAGWRLSPRSLRCRRRAEGRPPPSRRFRGSAGRSGPAGGREPAGRAAMKKPDGKVVLLGDMNVGKTSLLHRYMERRFQETVSTVGGAFYLKQWGPYNISIWDTAGETPGAARPPPARGGGGGVSGPAGSRRKGPPRNLPGVRRGWGGLLWLRRERRLPLRRLGLPAGTVRRSVARRVFFSFPQFLARP